MTKLEELQQLDQQAKARAHQEQLQAKAQAEAHQKKQEAAQYRAFKKNLTKLLQQTVVSFQFEGKKFEFTGQEILTEILKYPEGFGRCAKYGFLDYFGKDDDKDELRKYFIDRINMPAIARPQLNKFLESLEQLRFMEIPKVGSYTHYGVGSDSYDYDIDTMQYNLSPWAKQYLKSSQK